MLSFGTVPEIDLFVFSVVGFIVEYGTRIAIVFAFCVLCSVLAIGAGGAMSYDPKPAVGLETTQDGGWWILVASQGYGDETRVYVLPDRRTVSRSRTISVPTNASEAAIGLERGPTGQWYVLTTDRIHILGPDWTPLNRSIDLPGTSRSILGEGGLAHDESGQWWVAHDDVLYRYSEEWERTATMNVSADAVSAIDGEIYVLQGNEVARITHSTTKPSLETRWSMEWELSDPSLLARTDGFWQVIDTRGSVYRYTSYGQYTGESTTLAIETSIAGINLLRGVLILGYPVIVLVWFVLPGIAVVSRPDRWAEIVGAAGFGSLGTIAMYRYLLPWPFSLVYWLPDLLIGTLLTFGASVLVGRLLGSRKLFALSLLLLSPIGIVSWLFSPLALITGPAAATLGFTLLNRRTETRSE